MVALAQAPEVLTNDRYVGVDGDQLEEAIGRWPWRLILEVDFATPQTGTPDQWVDLSDRLRADVPISIAYGTDVDDSSCTLTLNNFDRALDPTNTESPYQPRPRRHARLSVQVGTVRFPLYRGLVEDWPPTWPDFGTGLVQVRLIDATAAVAQHDVDVLQLPRQRTHERIERLLDLAGWPADLRDIGPGVVMVEPVLLESANLLRTAQDVADTEDGEFYVAPDGRITFRSRHHRFDREPALHVGDGGVRFTDVTPAYGAGAIVNYGRLELDDGRVIEVVDEDSYAEFGRAPHTVRDLPVNVHEAKARVEWPVRSYSEPKLWLDGLTFEANDVPIGQVLAIRPGDLVDFRYLPPGGGVAEMVGGVDTVTHTIGWETWQIRFDVSPRRDEGPFAIVNHPTRGRLNAGFRFAP